MTEQNIKNYIKIFAERLKELRTEKGLSGMAFGKAIGVGDATIIRWENNQNDVKAEQPVKVAVFLVSQLILFWA